MNQKKNVPWTQQLESYSNSILHLIIQYIKHVANIVLHNTPAYQLLLLVILFPSASTNL